MQGANWLSKTSVCTDLFSKSWTTFLLPFPLWVHSFISVHFWSISCTLALVYSLPQTTVVMDKLATFPLCPPLHVVCLPPPFPWLALLFLTPPWSGHLRYHSSSSHTFVLTKSMLLATALPADGDRLLSILLSDYPGFFWGRKQQEVNTSGLKIFKTIFFNSMIRLCSEKQKLFWTKKNKSW